MASSVNESIRRISLRVVHERRKLNDSSEILNRVELNNFRICTIPDELSLNHGPKEDRRRHNVHSNRSSWPSSPPQNFTGSFIFKSNRTISASASSTQSAPEILF